jgi:hypothetical protein
MPACWLCLGWVGLSHWNLRESKGVQIFMKFCSFGGACPSVWLFLGCFLLQTPVQKVQKYSDLRDVLMRRIVLSTLQFRVNTRYKVCTKATHLALLSVLLLSSFEPTCHVACSFGKSLVTGGDCAISHFYLHWQSWQKSQVLLAEAIRV